MDLLELAGNINWGMVTLFATWFTAFVGLIIKYKIDMKVLQLKQRTLSDDVEEVKKTQHSRRVWAEELVKNEKIKSEERFRRLEDNNSIQHEKILDKFDSLLEKLNKFMVYVERKVK